MIGIQDGARLDQIEVVLGRLAPRHAEDPLEVVPDRGGFGGVRMHALELLQLALDLLRGLRGQRQLARLFPAALDLLAELVPFAQLRHDGFHLVAEIDLALGAVHLVFRHRIDLALHRQERHLPLDEIVNALQARHGIEDLQDVLRFTDLQLEVRGDEVGQASGVLEVRGDDQHFRREALPQTRRALERSLDRSDERLLLDRRTVVLPVGDPLDLGRQVRTERGVLRDPRAADALDQDADALVGELQHPHDDGDRADLVEVAGLRVLFVLVALGGEQDHPVLGERAVHRLDRQITRDRQRRDDEREHDHVAQRQNRKLCRNAEVGVDSRAPGSGSCRRHLDRYLFPAPVRDLGKLNAQSAVGQHRLGFVRVHGNA